MKNWDKLSKYGEEVINSFALTPLRLGPYVRIRPPDISECNDVKKDPRFLKFLRVGVKVEITDLGDKFNDEFIDVRCGGDIIVWNRKEFQRTFVRLIDGNEFRKNEALVPII
jgi:hypothetical protein